MGRRALYTAMILICLAFGLTGCGSSPAPENPGDDAQGDSPSQVQEKAIPSGVESDLKQKLQAKAGDEDIISFNVDDFAGDGNYEAFALTGKQDAKDASHYYEGTVWFVSDQGASVAADRADFSLPAVFTVGNKKLIRFEQAEGDTGSVSQVFGVEKGKAYLTNISGQVQNLTQLSDGTFVGEQNRLDGHTGGTGRTVKPYWFYWNSGFREYGGKEILESNLAEFSGGSAIMTEIKDKGDTLLSIIYRKNNIINLNCRTSKGDNYYINLHYNGTSVVTADSDRGSGEYGLALLSKYAVYPPSFQHPNS